MAPTVAGRPSVRPASGVDSGGGGEGGGGDRYRGSLLCMTEAAAAERPFGPLGGVVRSVGRFVGLSMCSFIIRRKSISSGGGKIQFGPRFRSLERMEERGREGSGSDSIEKGPIIQVNIDGSAGMQRREGPTSMSRRRAR